MRKFVAIFGLLIAISIAWFLFPFEKPAATFTVEEAFLRGICQKEAVLTASELQVFDRVAGKEIALLSKGEPVYLCAITESYQHIIYPQNGTSADCSSRSNNQCSAGFIRLPFETIILG